MLHNYQSTFVFILYLFVAMCFWNSSLVIHPWIHTSIAMAVMDLCVVKKAVTQWAVIQGALVVLQSLFPRYSQWTHHRRVRYGVFIVIAKSELCFPIVIGELYAISCYIGPRYIESLLYIAASANGFCQHTVKDASTIILLYRNTCWAQIHKIGFLC